MCSRICLAAAKVVALAGFLVLLSSTYYLRTEVLKLNEIGFSSDQARAEYEQEQLKADFPHEVEQYEVAKQNYKLQMEHYQQMLDLYKTDYDAYAQRLKDEYQPPQLPNRPQPPRPPEFTQQLSEINAEFRTQKHHYFDVTSKLNWVAWAAATCLVGGLLCLILFETGNGRLIYFATLVLSFTFMIGPSFHSILSAIVGFLKAPGVY